MASLIWCDFTIANEPRNPTLVRINAVLVVVMGDIGFHGMGDLAVA